MNILPLGDSRVEGGRPEFDSYRFFLWTQLVDAGWEVDFIGNRKDEQTYPKREDGRCFDTDHQGLGGEVTIGVQETLATLVYKPAPDVVLLGIGGNDLADGGRSAEETLTSLEEIIVALQTQYPGVSVLVEQIAPGRSDFMTSELTTHFLEFNAGVGQLAQQLHTDSTKVIAIDMAAGWGDNLMADQVHYNEAGAQLVADRYFQAMVEHIR
ncbi:MAG: GDSL-type esterase/lipase family protein [Bacteroidota bacterium]